jgi:hypothetical protein
MAVVFRAGLFGNGDDDDADRVTVSFARIIDHRGYLAVPCHADRALSQQHDAAAAGKPLNECAPPSERSPRRGR